ncbi:MAG: 7-cyano-7-deazaguanine synthase QueC [Acidimicrobiales bacterium]|nr:7-cyano-7-deazaguanine synthase QueC [Acidimicrobiales bacterium]
MVTSAPASSAVVLLSGGLDSATCLAIAQAMGFRCHALSFRYGQRHAVELDAAAQIATAAGVEHIIVELDLRTIGGSALTSNIPVPKHDSVDEIQGTTSIPVTYVPARNTIFLAFALGFAEVRGASDIFIGVNALDYSGYPDCRPQFIDAFERLANLATAAAVSGDTRIRIHTPLISLTKAEIIKRGLDLGVDYSLTRSCYDPDPAGVACGRCDSCLLRQKGFRDAGATDPIPYRHPQER